MEKQYRILTEDQFRRLIAKLPEFRQESKSMQEALRSASKEKLRDLLGDGVWWADIYELSLGEGLAFMLYVFGEIDRINVIAQLPDPQEVLLREVEEGKELEWDGGPGGVFTTGYLIALATALQRNVLSIMIHKKSLSALIAEVREGDDDALFDAVRIDRTAVSCPTVAKRISRAELLQEKHFFIRLRNALKGLSRKHMEAYRDLRYSLAVLRELGFDRLTDAELEHLLVDVLKVYAPSSSARKNLRKQYYESKKIRTL